MMLLYRLGHWTLVTILGLMMILPLPAWSAVASLGMARGIRTVELTLDGGKSGFRSARPRCPFSTGPRSVAVMAGRSSTSRTGAG